MKTTFEDKTVKELLALLETVAPTVTAELRDRLKDLEREIYSDGFSAGLDEGVERATVPDEEHFLKGEAKGMSWAYYAAKGGKMAPNKNPYVNPALVERLLGLGEKNKK